MALTFGQKLGAGFAAAALIASPVIATSTSPAFAQSAQTQQVSLTTSQPISRLQAAARSDHAIVFHYGPGITLADNAAQLLSQDNFPAAAYAGGQPGQIEMFVNKRPAGTFTNTDAARGVLTSIAKTQYNTRVLGQEGPQLTSY